MGGTSGALYSILFKAAAVALDETEVAADAMKTQDSNDHELNILIKTLDVRLKERNKKTNVLNAE